MLTWIKDFDKFKARFRQFGGWRLVWQYARMGVLWTGVKALLRCAINGKSLKSAYPVITKSVDEILTKKYRHILDENRDWYKEGMPGNESQRSHTVPKIVWTAWLQGTENAPELVKACLASQKKHLGGYEFRVLDVNNYQQWVELPKYVVRKYQKGQIPPAAFSDLLRLAVLKKYGGIWMDATVYCSGFEDDNLKARWKRIEQSELTFFRYFERGRKEPIGISNWFIAAVPEHIVISNILDMLLAYWKDFNCLVNYYVFHMFLGLNLKEYPKVAAKMPQENSFHSLLLGNALGRTYRENDWQELKEHVSIHKLNFRKAKEAMKNPKGYYNYITKNFQD